MEVVKSTKESTIFKKKSGKFAVKGPKKKWINGDEKVKILVAAGLVKIKVAAPKKEEAPASDAAE